MTLTVVAGSIPARLPRHLHSARPRSRVGSLIAAGVIAVGAMTALAPTANAQTEQQIKAGCDEAKGSYSVVLGSDGSRSSNCCYKDYKGTTRCDSYENGVYTGTSGPARLPGPPVTGPGTNPPVENPPITNPPPAAAPPPGANPPVQNAPVITLPPAAH